LAGQAEKRWPLQWDPVIALATALSDEKTRPSKAEAVVQDLDMNRFAFVHARQHGAGS